MNMSQPIIFVLAWFELSKKSTSYFMRSLHIPCFLLIGIMHHEGDVRMMSDNDSQKLNWLAGEL